MSDKLVVEIDSKDAEVAMRNLDRLTTAAEQMGKAFENTKGATSALRELRLMLTGIKGQGSSLDELKNSIQSLNSTADSLKKSFAGSVGQLGRIFKNEMAELKSIVQETGLGVGRAAAKGIEDGMAEAPAAIRKQGRTIAAAAKAEATRIYEAMVAGQANAKIKDVSALFKLDEAGATLSPYHKQVLENWKKSSAETFKALKAQLADESQKIAAAVKTEEAQLQAALKAMEQNSSIRESALAGIYASSLARGKQDIARVKANLKGQAAEIKATVKTEEAALQAALGAMEQASTIRQSSLASIYAGSLSRGKQDMARVKAQLKLQADEIIAEAKTEAGRIQAQVAAATNNASGAFQRYSPNTGMAGAVVDPLAKGPKKQDVTGLAEAFDKLTISGNNAHSMARGLASGFGLLWLTWGNLAPLFVGAAISNGFMQTAKTGMAVAHTLETIAVLGGNTKEEMAALSNELSRLGNSGPQGPLAIADAMKVLSLAGLKANEIIAVTQDVLNFSISGTTDLKTAADTLISVSTAFGMGAAGFGRVGDVIAKAAAESKTSVDSFANAMKTASVINAQYGVSLEDTATGIAALSQLGIEGTAAGTALRNMYADLSGRSMQVAKVLKAQGIEMRTATGEFRPMLEVVADLNTKLQAMTGIGQKNLLQALLSERGAKGIVEMLRLINTEAKDMGSGMKNALQEMRAAIEESYGFSAMSAARMAQTAEQQFAAVKATLQTSMNTAYKEMEPTLLLIADAMRKVLASPEFIEGLKTMVGLLANLGLGFLNMTTFVVDNWKAIALASAAYMGLRSIIVSKTTAMTAATAATVADTAATVANNAAKTGAAGALATMGRLIPGIGTAVSIAATAWMAYDMWQNSAKNTAKEADDLYNNNVVKSLNDQANRIEALNELRRTGLSLTEAQAVLDARGQTKQATGASASNYAQAAAKEAAAWKEVERLRKTGVTNFQNPNGFGYVTLEYFEARAKEASNAAKAAFQLETQTIIAANTAKQRVVDASREQQRITDAEIAERQKKWKTFGVQGFELAGPGKNKNNSVEQIRVANDNELKEIEKRNAAELSMMQNQAANAQKILDARHQAGLISEGEYQAQAFAQVKQSEADQLAMLNASKAEYMNGLVARATVLGDALQKAMKLGDDTQIEKFTTELQNLGQTAETFYTGVDNSIAKIADNGMARLGVASIKAQAAIEKLADTEREYWKKDKDEINKLRSLDEMEAKYKNINESVFSLDAANKAAAMTGAAEAEKFSAKLAEMDYAYEVAEQAALAFMTANITALASGDTEAQRLYKGLRDVADALKAAREAAGIKAEASIRDRSLIAFEKARQAQIDAFSNGLADAVETSIFEGGKAGGQKFIEVIRNELLRKPLVAMIRGVMGNVVGSIFGSAGGALGLAGTASAATAAASGGSILGSAGGILSGVGALAGNFGAGLTTGFSGLMAGNLGSTLGLGTGLIGSGATAGGIGTIVGALAPISLGIGALVAISKATKGETRTGGQFGVAFDGSVTNQRRGQTYVIEGQQFDRDFTNGMKTALKDGIAYRLEGDPVAQEQAIRNAVSGTAASINNILKSLGSAAVLTGFSAGLETSSKGRGGVFAGGTLSGGLQFGESGKGDNYDGTLYEKFSTNSPDFKTALENFTLDLKQSTVQALQTVSDIPKTVQMMLAGVDAESLTEEAANQLLEAINSQVVGVNTLRAAISPMGGIFSSIAAASFDAQSRLISLSGGVDQFLQNAGQFVSQYYSETEQAGVAAVRLATVLEGVGIDLTALGVDTKGEFRALVESMDVNTDAGQEQVAALLQVAPQFAELADFLQKNNMTLEQLADSAPQVSALEKLLSPQEQTAASTAESAELLGNLVGETSRVSSAIRGLAASIESSTVNIVVQNQASSNVTVPRFAAGGAHQGGMRLVGENGPEFEFTGPSAIYSTSNSTDMLAAAVERGFIAGAAKSTLSVKSMAPMAQGPKTAEDIFLTNFKDWYPEFADRLNKDTIKQLMNFDLLKFSASGSSVTPELLDTVLKLFEEGFSSDKVNQYVELIRGPNPEGQVTNPNLYLEQFKLRTQWGWTQEQIKAEVQGLATTALDSTLKSLYAGVVSRKDLDQVRQVVGESSNAAGITQENLAKLFDAGLLRDYISKDAAGQYSLRASEMFSQGGADGAANAEQQRMNDLLAERRQLEIQLLQAQGQEQEALNRIRANAIEGMSAEAVAAWDFNRALEKQIEQAQQVADLKQEHRNLQLELLKAQGRGEEALALIREEAIKGMTAEAVALYDVNQAVREQIDILNERKGLERRLLEAQGDTAAIRQLELAATHEANRAILLRIWALEDEKKAAEAAQTAVDAAFDALKRAVQSAQEAAEKALKDAYEATEKTLKEQISAAEKIKSAASESLSSLEGIFDLLKDQIKDLRNEAGAAAPVSEGYAYLDRLIASGAKPKQDELADAIESVRAGQKAERYGTAFEYNRDNLVLAGRLDVLQSKVGLEKTIAEQQLKAAEDSLVTLNEQLETAKTQYEEQLAKTKEYYEKVLENAQTQIDVLRGVDKSVLSVTAAVTALNTAVAYAAAQVTAAVLSTNADTTAAKVEPVNFRARGGYTPAGLTVVGEEGPELVNFAQPSMVYTSAQTRNLLGWGDSEGVIAELRSLREDNRAQAQALVRMQARLVALMERWDGDGMPEERATA